ncbi:hypothetical protein LTR96_011471 [Exophiala xenobiotica]|nr:hypothetical protein LTR92_010940 [Exophiala xenobiotica]KAK5263100.1 hypothetical protein LTR96_011471 [Exophiala xenobiotica]KAK5400015.1 hypothetical protein LTR06_011324 [Exophiala xenobiotica]
MSDSRLGQRVAHNHCLGDLENTLQCLVATPSVPLRIYPNLSAHIEEAVYQLVTRFRGIDHIVGREFTRPHEVARNPTRSSEDDTDLGPVKYRKEDTYAFVLLTREHHEDNYLAYLGDERYKRYWGIAFDSLAKTGGRGSIWWPDIAQIKIRSVGNKSKGIDELAKNAMNGEELPRYIQTGIWDRIRLLNSFLDTCESIMARHNAGSRSSYDALSERPNFSDEPGHAYDVAAATSPGHRKNVVLAYPTRNQRILAALNDDRSTIGITSIATVVATALSFTTFSETDPWDRKNFSKSELFNYIQGAVLLTLGLGLTVLPLVQVGSLGKYASGWVGHRPNEWERSMSRQSG